MDRRRIAGTAHPPRRTATSRQHVSAVHALGSTAAIGELSLVHTHRGGRVGNVEDLECIGGAVTLREVGVVGGRRTVLSGCYGRALRKQRFCVLQRVSLDLSVEIENGHAKSAHTRQLVEGLLEPLFKKLSLRRKVITA